MKTYHIVAINERTGAKEYMTRYPLPHNESVVMMMKLANHPARRIQLEEFTGERTITPSVYVYG